MEDDMETTVKLEQLFRACDMKGTGFIGRQELRELCTGLGIGAADSDILFDDLDHDGDSRIDFEDFVQGFRDYVANPHAAVIKGPTRAVDDDAGNDDDSGGGDVDVLSAIGSGSAAVVARRHPSRRSNCMQTQQQNSNDAWKAVLEHIKQTSSRSISATKVQELQGVLTSLTSSPQLATCFEAIVQSLMQDMQRLQCDNERLEDIYRVEKTKHEKHLRQIEDEIDAHVQKVEEKLKEQMREEAEAEIKTLKAKMDEEMGELQSHLKIFQTFDSLLKKDRKDESHSNGLRNRLDEASHENRKLRLTLTDTQTNIALMHNELAYLRSQYEDKCKELHSERENSLHFLHEQDHFIRQLQLLQSANKRLQDANDSIRSAVETNIFTHRPSSINDSNNNNGPSNNVSHVDSTNSQPVNNKPRSLPRMLAKRGSVIGDYLRGEDLTSSNKDNSAPQIGDGHRGGGHLALTSGQETDSCYDSLTEPLKALRRGCSQEEMTFGMKRFMDDLDSGLSTSRDPMELEEQEQSGRNSTQVRRISTATTTKQDFDMEVIPLGGEELDTGASDWAVLPVASPVVTAPRLPRQPSLLRTSSRQSLLLGHAGSPAKMTAFLSNNNNNNGIGPFCCDEIRNCYEATGPPDRMYKVVFAGDAAVGKTTFIVRISKGFFVSMLTSTLGVDFHVKTFRVDEKNVSLQLWDTAGQERFRCVTKSYFRRADGVMLLYDCTSEHSFLNVRDWMEAIDEVSEKRIPVMLCANKIDVRETALLQGKSIVRTDDGERLARDFSAIFIETSAKSGKNVVDSLIQLTREMAANEDLEVKTSGLKITDAAPSRRSTACCSRK